MLVERSFGHIDLIDLEKKEAFPVPPALNEELIRFSKCTRTDNLSEAAQKFLRESVPPGQNSSDKNRTISAQLESLDLSYRWCLENRFDKSDLEKIYRPLLAAHAKRKFIRYSCFQGPCLPESAARKALLMSHDVGCGNVLCVGDDDLVSIGLAILGAAVTVIDIDEYLLRLIGDTASELGLNIQTINYDIRQPLIPELLNKFDAVSLDPVSSENWLKLFLSRASSCLKPDGRCYLSVYDRKEFIARSVLGALKLNEALFYQGFSRYYNEYIEYEPSLDSGLFVVTKTENTVELVLPGEKFHDEGLSDTGSFSNSFMADFYECKTLSAEIFKTLCAGVERQLNISPENAALSLDKKTLIYQAILQDGHISILANAEKGYAGFDIHEIFHPDLRNELIEIFKRNLHPVSWKVFEKSRYLSHVR